MVRFKKALLERGLALGELGRLLGMRGHRFYISAAGNFADSMLLRYRIEQFFEYQEAIWSTKEVLELRGLCQAATGRDPFVVAKPVLLSLVAQFGVRLAGVSRNIASLRDALIRHLAVNRHLLQPVKAGNAITAP